MIRSYFCTSVSLSTRSAGCELQLCLRGVNDTFAYILDALLVDLDLCDRDDDFPGELAREEVVPFLCFRAKCSQGQAATWHGTDEIPIEIEKVARVIGAPIGNDKGGLSLWTVRLVDAAPGSEIEVEAGLCIAFVLLCSENGGACGDWQQR